MIKNLDEFNQNKVKESSIFLTESYKYWLFYSAILPKIVTVTAHRFVKC